MTDETTQAQAAGRATTPGQQLDPQFFAVVNEYLELTNRQTQGPWPEAHQHGEPVRRRALQRPRLPVERRPERRRRTPALPRLHDHACTGRCSTNTWMASARNAASMSANPN